MQMKTIVKVILISVLTVFSLNCRGKQSDKKQVMYVYASALNVRDQPDIDGKKTDLLSALQKVEVIERSPEETEIEGRTGKWVKIQYGENEGWVFDAFLSDSKSYAGHLIKKNVKTVIVKNSNGEIVNKFEISEYLKSLNKKVLATGRATCFEESFSCKSNSQNQKLVKIDPESIKEELSGIDQQALNCYKRYSTDYPDVDYYICLHKKSGIVLDYIPHYYETGNYKKYIFDDMQRLVLSLKNYGASPATIGEDRIEKYSYDKFFMTEKSIITTKSLQAPLLEHIEFIYSNGLIAQTKLTRRHLSEFDPSSLYSQSGPEKFSVTKLQGEIIYSEEMFYEYEFYE